MFEAFCGGEREPSLNHDPDFNVSSSLFYFNFFDIYGSMRMEVKYNLFYFYFQISYQNGLRNVQVQVYWKYSAMVLKQEVNNRSHESNSAEGTRFPAAAQATSSLPTVFRGRDDSE